MNVEYTVRLYRKGDEKDIVMLLGSVFNGWPKFDLQCSPLEHWKWKYTQNPLKLNSINLGVSQGRIIGVDHSLLLRVKLGDNTILCHYAADTAVHPDFRKRGVSNKLIALNNKMRMKENVQLIYFVSGDPIMIKAWSRTYPRFPKDILNFVRIRDINLQLRKMPINNVWLMKLGFRTAKLLNDLMNMIRISVSGDKDVQISEIFSFDSRIDEFWDRVSSHYEFIVERKRDYLNWRYCDPRSGGFVVKQAEGDGHILGYSVLRINRYKTDYPVGYIVDLLTLPERRDVTDALMADAVQYFDEQDVNIIVSITTKNHPNERSLRKYGFLNSRIKPHIFCWMNKYQGENIKFVPITVDKVHFSYGDIDSLPASLPV